MKGDSIQLCVIFPWYTWALAQTPSWAWGITWGVVRFKFPKSKQTWQHKAFFRKLFPPNLVSYLHYQLFLLFKTSIFQAISKPKHSFKLLCWNVNKYCDVDDHTGYHSILGCERGNLAKSRFWFVCRTCVKNSLTTKLIAEKLIRWPLMINAKSYSAAKAEGMCKIVKKIVEWNSSKMEISNLIFIEAKSTPQNFFIIFRFFFHG